MIGCIHMMHIVAGGVLIVVHDYHVIKFIQQCSKWSSCVYPHYAIQVPLIQMTATVIASPCIQRIEAFFNNSQSYGFFWVFSSMAGFDKKISLYTVQFQTSLTNFKGLRDLFVTSKFLCSHYRKKKEKDSRD